MGMRQGTSSGIPLWVIIFLTAIGWSITGRTIDSLPQGDLRDAAAFLVGLFALVVAFYVGVSINVRRLPYWKYSLGYLMMSAVVYHQAGGNPMTSFVLCSIIGLYTGPLLESRRKQ